MLIFHLKYDVIVKGWFMEFACSPGVMAKIASKNKNFQPASASLIAFARAFTRYGF